MRLRLLPTGMAQLLAATVVNAAGNGMVYPFMVPYLHRAQGLPLGAAGVVLAMASVTAIVTTPLAGELSDRWGPRLTALLSVAASIAGFVLLLDARSAPTAGFAAVFIGIGQGALWPTSTTIVSRLAATPQRPMAFAWQRVAMNLGMGLGAAVGGLVARADDPDSYRRLIQANLASFLAYLLLIGTLRVPGVTSREASALGAVAGWRAALGHPLFRWLLLLDFLAATTFAYMFDLLPEHVTGGLGYSTRVVSAMFVVNTALIVVIQLPIARLAAGRARLMALAAMNCCFAGGFVAVLGVAGLPASAVPVLLCAATAVFGIGECIMGAVRSPLVADLAPPAAVGRFMGLTATAFQTGLATGRASGGFVLDRSPTALWSLGLVTALFASFIALALRPTVPAPLRLAAVAPQASAPRPARPAPSRAERAPQNRTEQEGGGTLAASASHRAAAPAERSTTGPAERRS